MTIATKIVAGSYETLKLELVDSVLTIKIDRPKALNALSKQVIADLREVISLLLSALGKNIDEQHPDWSVRGIIITGAGDRSFVAGGDIAEMSESSPSDIQQYAGDAQELTLWLEQLPVPVIAAVNGFALGGGCEVALACDMIFASANASFGQPEVALGLIPGFGGTVRLQKAVGAALAADLIYSGRRIASAEAQEIGLVARVFPTINELLAGAHGYFDLVKAQSPLAVATAKRTLRAVSHLSNKAGLEIELDAFANCFTTADMREGTRAFIEKRKASFAGK